LGSQSKSSAFRGALDYATFEWKLKEAQPNFNAAMKALNSSYGRLAKGNSFPAIPSTLLSAPPQAAARPPRPHRVLAFAQGLSAHHAAHPLCRTVHRQDATPSRIIGKHVLKIQGQRIDLIVVTGYGESNELVAEVDGPRLVVENVDPSIDKKMEEFLETLFLVAAADGPELGSPSLCGQHRMLARARRGIFDQQLLDAIRLKQAHRGVAHLDRIEARSEHVQDVVSSSIGGND
jgi:hypothetical protein